MTIEEPHQAVLKSGSTPLEPDERQLDVIAQEEELPRQFDIFSMLALAFTVLGTWSTLAQDLASGLTYGGPVSILWGLCCVTVCNLCLAVSLGELTSSMPTALGQAYWIYRLWTTPSGRFVSYMCAWINTFGWWTLTASQLAFMTEYILGMKVMFQEDWSGASKGWLNFVIYVGLTILLTLINIVACRKKRVLPWINNVVGLQFMLLFFVFALAMLISVGVHHPLRQYQSASFVFGTWSNETNWPSGVVWFIGLVQSAYGLTAMDAAIHMVEELPKPSVNGPRVIWLSVLMGAVTGFLFMVVCLFTIQSQDAVENADLPFQEIVLEAVGLQGAAVLLVLFIFNGVGQAISIMTTGSRLTWGFARDGGLPWHRRLARISHTWHTPVWALLVQGFLVALVGVLYLFSNEVLTAILSVSTIALTISYAMPIVALLVVGRDKLPSSPFRLGRTGFLINVVSVVYCVITSIFFFFPGDPDPAISDMNWAIAVFGVMLVVSLGFWVVQGKQSYLRTEDAMFRVISARQQQEIGLSNFVEDPQNQPKTKHF